MTRKNKISLALIMLVSCLIVVYSMRDIPFKVLLGNLATLNWWWVGVAIGSMLLSIVLEGLVVKKLLGPGVSQFTLKDALRIPVIEQLFNGITPFATGGQPAQLLALMQSGIEAGKATSVLLMKFVVYQAMIVLNFLFCLLIGFDAIKNKVQVLAWLVILGFVIHFLVIFMLLMIMYYYNFTKAFLLKCLAPLKWLKKEELYHKWKKIIIQKVDSFYAESIRLKNDYKLIVKVSCLTLIQLFFYYIIPYFILLALGVSHTNVIKVMIMHVLIVMIISLFPIPGGVGGAEYSFTLVFSAYLTVPSKLVLAMLLWRLITYYMVMFLGIVALGIKPKKITVKGNSSAID
ncbi:lysylphosphatidylglycerol synthase transmembrane domain-containing protein [Ligilactobacillus ceti]|uniref:Phosphatidylglycerol lysyltransferase n=1 Tax=Ligilactobacillus ceti DSM 22408 TaxID=1122146 RepID=A0A0R2KLP4_9LACO|nr:lysylphosphatidylglycerol synthase transmembrane domain-containing protein [Ligilactobacillus ceti]KRN90382.1 integral membrane protein [Ligilactobacillus ceti DSM 22408]